MKRRIHIILLEQDFGWQNMLNQTGASWSAGFSGELRSSDASCIIINREPSETETGAIHSFLDNGGTVIDTTGIIYGESVKVQRINELKPYLHNTEITNCAGTIHLRDKTGFVSDDSFLKGVVAFQDDKNIVHWGIEPGQFYKDFEKSHRTFTHSTLPSVSERTARCSSGEVSKLLLLTLIRLHRDAGLPYIRKWLDMDSEMIPATFRIDYDFGQDEYLVSLSELLNSFNLPATWFLHTDALTEKATAAVISNPQFETALHCHRHVEFKQAEDYKSDIRNGLNRLQELGFEVSGYAAPYGNWSAALQKAIESFEFQYSSEFCYDYDAEPSLPSGGGTLQVPVHPVSIGSLNWFSYSREMMKSYFKEVIDLKKLQYDSLHLYHHPNDRHTEVLETAFENAKIQGFRFMSYSDFADNRNQINDREAYFYANENGIEIDYPFASAIHRDRSVAVTGKKQISLNELDFVSFAHQNCADLIRKREQNNTLSNFKRLKYAFLAWRWRNKA